MIIFAKRYPIHFYFLLDKKYKKYKKYKWTAKYVLQCAKFHLITQSRNAQQEFQKNSEMSYGQW